MAGSAPMAQYAAAMKENRLRDGMAKRAQALPGAMPGLAPGGNADAGGDMASILQQMMSQQAGKTVVGRGKRKARK